MHPQLKDPSPRLEETHSSLSDKFETMEHDVREMVQGANEAMSSTVASLKEAVSHTTEAARESVHDTVEAVRHAFDLKHHMKRHPWAILFAAVVAGYILSCFIPARASEHARA